MLQAYRCNFCGDVYMGTTAPSHCPYCGAHSVYLVPVLDWKSPELTSLTEISRNNLQRSTQLEVNNQAFYAATAAKIPQQEWVGIFKYLSRVEGEHAGTIRKALGAANNPEPEKFEVFEALRESLLEAKARESRAGAFYQQSLDQATEPRVKVIFSCLIMIEADHLALATETLAKL